ncbi:hypothetical protein SRRS_05840 [Sporomusa rhizae]|uniref:hypothetical protein n=1 Tax=Sporomusa rhizae TaxID=357999 RepID=UPI00352B8518
MGFFESLFGGGSKPTPKKKKVVEEAVSTAPAVGLPPDVIAAISASIKLVLDDESDAAIAAAVTAAIMHDRQGRVTAAKINSTSNVWSVTGRQKVMDARL